MIQHRFSGLARLFLPGLLVLSAAFSACDDGGLPSDTTTTSTTTTGTAGNGGQGGAGGATGGGGAGGTGGAPDCVMNPTTHEEIINACTGAEKIDKQPVLPLLNPDGSLPPLP